MAVIKPEIIKLRFGDLCGVTCIRPDHFLIHTPTGRLRVIPISNLMSYVYLYRSGQNYGKGISAKVPDRAVWDLSFFLSQGGIGISRERMFESVEARLQNICDVAAEKKLQQARGMEIAL